MRIPLYDNMNGVGLLEW